MSNCGYSTWNKDARHREHCKTLGIFEDVWPENGGHLHWRLTREERLLLDERMSFVCWPHNVEPLFYKGASFWKKPGHMWKARRKYRLLFFILPTQLRDQVPRFRNALLLFAWSIRRLVGQVHSKEYAEKVLGILPGSPTVLKSEVLAIHRDLVRSLALFEGCTPVDHLKPVMHHYAHYAFLTIKFALLTFLWMMGFERYNKFLKGLVRNVRHPDINLAHAVCQAETANYFEILEDINDLPDDLCHGCCLSMPGRQDSLLSESEVGSLRVLGSNVQDIFASTEYNIAWILGKHFRAAEWGKYRCGSVITCVISGRSVYARVSKFFTIDGDNCEGYASVTWFGAPEYPLDGSPLVVRCREEEPRRLVDAYGCVVKITQIDPSQVIVERDENTGYCWMMRDSGYDTIRV